MRFARAADPNRYELFAGQHSMLKAMGQPYSELGRVRIVDTRSKMAIGHVEFSCETIVPGDIAVPFVEKPPTAFHPPERFDRFLPEQRQTPTGASCWPRISIFCWEPARRST